MKLDWHLRFTTASVCVGSSVELDWRLQITCLEIGLTFAYFTNARVCIRSSIESSVLFNLWKEKYWYKDIAFTGHSTNAFSGCWHLCACLYCPCEDLYSLSLSACALWAKLDAYRHPARNKNRPFSPSKLRCLLQPLPNSCLIRSYLAMPLISSHIPVQKIYSMSSEKGPEYSICSH